MLADRFGLFEALASSTIKLNRCTQADELAIDPLVCAAPAPPRTSRRTPRAWFTTGSKRRQRKPPERQQARTEANSRGRASAAAVVFIVIACD
jgi:hypothetical protein